VFVQITPPGSILVLTETLFPLKLHKEICPETLSLSERHVANNSRGILSDKEFKYLTYSRVSSAAEVNAESTT
jgi:hypothetical protein